MCDEANDLTPHFPLYSDVSKVVKHRWHREAPRYRGRQRAKGPKVPKARQAQWQIQLLPTVVAELHSTENAKALTIA